MRIIFIHTANANNNNNNDSWSGYWTTFIVLIQCELAVAGTTPLCILNMCCCWYALIFNTQMVFLTFFFVRRFSSSVVSSFLFFFLILNEESTKSENHLGAYDGTTCGDNLFLLFILLSIRVRDESRGKFQVHPRSFNL